MRKVSVFFVLFLCGLISTQAKDLPKKGWYKGQMVLNNGKNLEGKIQYDLKQNVVLVKQKDLVKAYSVYKVNYFKFLDKEMGMIRRFFSIPYQKQNGLTRMQFFELVFEDDFALFSREASVSKKHALMHNKPFIPLGEDKGSGIVRIFEYYIFTPDGNFQKIQTEEKDIAETLSLDKKEKKEMHQFILQNDLNLRNCSDFIKVIYELV